MKTGQNMKKFPEDKNIYCEVTVTLTFDHQNLISYSLSPTEFHSDLNTFPRGVLEILSSQEQDGRTDRRTDGRTDGQPETRCLRPLGVAGLKALKTKCLDWTPYASRITALQLSASASQSGKVAEKFGPDARDQRSGGCRRRHTGGSGTEQTEQTAC